MNRLFIPLLLLVFTVITAGPAPAQRRTKQTQNMAVWAGKYPDAKFLNQLAIKTPLRRILTKADYDSIGDYNLMIPIKRIGDYLVTYATEKYSDPLNAVSIVFGLKDKSVYIVFWNGEQHRKFSTRNNQFNLPDEVLEEIGLKEDNSNPAQLSLTTTCRI